MDLNALSLDQAADILAGVAVVRRRLIKTAVLSKYTEPIKQNLTAFNDTVRGAVEPAVSNLMKADTPAWQAGRNALLGGAAGAGIAGLSNMGRPRRKRRTLGDMAQGALMGGVVGGAGTAFYHGLNMATNKTPAQVTAEAAQKKLEQDYATHTEAAAAAPPGPQRLLHDVGAAKGSLQLDGYKGLRTAAGHAARTDDASAVLGGAGGAVLGGVAGQKLDDRVFGLSRLSNAASKTDLKGVAGTVTKAMQERAISPGMAGSYNAWADRLGFKPAEGIKGAPGFKPHSGVSGLDIRNAVRGIRPGGARGWLPRVLGGGVGYILGSRAPDLSAYVGASLGQNPLPAGR